MYLGILYNIFICTVIGVTGLICFFQIQKLRKERKADYSNGLDYFILSVGIMWFLIDIRNIFNWIGRVDLNVFVFQWFSGPLVYVHLLPAFYFFGWDFFKDIKKRFLFNIFFTAIVLSAVFTFFKYGFVVGEVTYWGSNHKPNEITNNIFVYGIFVPALLFILVNLGRHLKTWKKERTTIQRQLLGFTIGFLIYALAGIIDALGIVKDWVMLLSRIGIMFAVLFFYLSATFDIVD